MNRWWHRAQSCRALLHVDMIADYPWLCVEFRAGVRIHFSLELVALPVCRHPVDWLDLGAGAALELIVGEGYHLVLAYECADVCGGDFLGSV